MLVGGIGVAVSVTVGVGVLLGRGNTASSIYGSHFDPDTGVAIKFNRSFADTEE